jgi:signal transduction histidine kinase
MLIIDQGRIDHVVFARSLSAVGKSLWRRGKCSRSRAISISFSICPTTKLAVRVDRNELEIIQMKLILNARDAMPDRGTIRVDVARTDLRKDADPHGLDGEFVSITVSNTRAGHTRRNPGLRVQALFYE